MESNDNNLQDGNLEKIIRANYEMEGVYNTATICHVLNEESKDYSDNLLYDKLQTVRGHYSDGLLLDLCCATGEHLFYFADIAEDCLGIDFSRPYIAAAKEKAITSGLSHVRFEVGDAKSLGLDTGSVSTLYSFSALYTIPDVEVVIQEISRVLRRGGRCVLDLGNSKSLNAICVRNYTELPPTFHVTVAEMRRICERCDLDILEHRSFQILPLWADRPWWLYPLLHPGWKRLLARRVRGKMLDEWISSTWLLRNFAFRHLLVCEKKCE